ncbi:MAG: HAD family hydrolase [Lachnospiraceae bacterium]
MYKLCIFDLDGTVADTLRSLWHTVNLCLDKFNLEKQPLEKFQYFAGDGSKALIERALIAAGDTTCEHFDRAYLLYRNLFEKGCTYEVKSFKGLEQVLTDMKNAGIKIAVFTNKDHDNALDVVNAIYDNDFFDCVLGYCNVYPRKPHPDGALAIAEKFGVKPEECMYVGDTNTDMKTGKAAGMYTVGVTWGFRGREELEEAGADIIVDQVDDLVRIAKQTLNEMEGAHR